MTFLDPTLPYGTEAVHGPNGEHTDYGLAYQYLRRQWKAGRNPQSARARVWQPLVAAGWTDAAGNLTALGQSKLSQFNVSTTGVDPRGPGRTLTGGTPPGSTTPGAGGWQGQMPGWWQGTGGSPGAGSPGTGGSGAGGNFNGLDGTFTPPSTATGAQQDAYAYIKGLLDQYGLGSLAEWAWGELVNNRAASQIALELYDQPAFKQRFPAIETRQKAGLPPISPGEYVSYEQQARQMFASAGFPQGMYDQASDFTAYIANDKSLAELSQQVALYQKAAYDVPAETRAYLRDTFGVTEGGLAAYFATPDEKLPQLISSLETAGIAGQAQRQQFGQLSLAEAQRLRSLGVTDQSAAQGFGSVYAGRELFHALPGEEGGTPGRAEALGFVAGDAQSQQAIDLQARRRRAPFQGGGGFANTQQTSGLGSAAT